MSQTDGSAGEASLLSYNNLIHAMSGATGSVISILLFYPLDTIRTRLQVADQPHAQNTFGALRETVREEGIAGLYSGWLSMACTMSVSSFVYFYTYAGLQFTHSLFGDKPEINKYKDSVNTMIIDLLIAFVAGVVNVLVSTPLWVVNTRLKLQGAKLRSGVYKKHDDHPGGRPKYVGMSDCLCQIVQQEGASKLWSGTVPSIILAVNPAIQFMVYESLKRYCRHLFNMTDLHGLVYFLLGAVAKIISTFATYPLQVIQSRLRAGYAKPESSLTLVQNITYLIRTHGVEALYKGMEAKLLQTVLTAAFMFLIYEKIAVSFFNLIS